MNRDLCEHYVPLDLGCGACERLQQVKETLDLRAEVEALRSCACADCNREILELRAEVEALRPDAERWRTIRTKMAGFIARNEDLLWVENPDMFDALADSLRGPA